MGDECTAFGCAKWPPSNGKYNDCDELMMLRSYNGSLYGRNHQEKISKVHSNDIINLTFDMDAKKLYYSINNSDPVLGFIDLYPVVYPAVCFYGKTRKIEVRSITCESPVTGITTLSYDIKTEDRKSVV